MAADVARRIAERGHTLVWGGSNVGTMKVVADAAKGAGGRIVGVSVVNFGGVMREDADDMYVAANLEERLRTFAEVSDAFVALPGGTGTLHELATVMEWHKYDLKKPIALLSTNGFYDGLKTQLERMEREKFLYEPLNVLVCIASTPEEALEYLERSTRAQVQGV